MHLIKIVAGSLPIEWNDLPLDTTAYQLTMFGMVVEATPITELPPASP